MVDSGWRPVAAWVQLPALPPPCYVTVASALWTSAGSRRKEDCEHGTLPHGVDYIFNKLNECLTVVRALYELDCYCLSSQLMSRYHREIWVSVPPPGSLQLLPITHRPVSLDVWVLTSSCAQIKGCTESRLRVKIHVHTMDDYRTKRGTLSLLCPRHLLPGYPPAMDPVSGTHGGGEHSGGGIRRSRARDGRGSSQSGPAARTRSALSPWGSTGTPGVTPLCRLLFI